MARDPIADAYVLGEEHTRERRSMDDLDEEERKRWMAFSPEQHRAYLRGQRDGQPAVAPLPLPLMVTFEAVHFVLLEHARRRGGRFVDYLRVSPAIGALVLLSTRLVPWQESRARRLGIERAGDAPRVPTRIAPLWIPFAVGWMIVRRLLRRPRPRTTNEQVVATQLADSLLRWWAWRPHRLSPRTPPEVERR